MNLGRFICQKKFLVILITSLVYFWDVCVFYLRKCPYFAPYLVVEEEAEIATENLVDKWKDL